MTMTPLRDDSDEVTKKLQCPSQPELLRSWLDQQLERDRMRQQTRICAFKAWFTLAAMALATTGIALYFRSATADLFPAVDFLEVTSLSSVRSGTDDAQSAAVPLLLILLIATNSLIVTALPLAWAFGRLPGFSSALGSVDWATAGDAMSRLLTIGCPYPDALRTTASVVSRGAQRRWLLQAAARVEIGGHLAPSSSKQSSEESVLFTMLSTQETPMQRDWQLASEHCQTVAERKVELLVAAAPVLATILAGLILWISVMTTLGSMWTTLGTLLEY